MKTFVNRLLQYSIVLVLAGCGIVQGGIDQYQGLITAYQNGRAAAANGSTCIVLSFGQINTQATLVNSYLTADVAKAKAWRDPLNNFGSKLSQQSQAYVDSKGQPINPNKLDLGQLVAQEATPRDMALTVNAYVSTFNEAPLAQVDSAPVLAAQRIVSEQFNQVFACVKDWNAAVLSYNTERNLIKGDIVGQLAQRLGVKDLPPELPYYTMAAPSVVPTIPPFGTPEPR